jgi:hypothetical protein
MGATLGLRLGPWGAVAGALIGSVAGATLSKRLLGDVETMPEVELEKH